MTRLVGQRWRFERLLRAGGQAEVWLVWDEQDWRWVVGKRWRAEADESVEDLLVRFEREVAHAQAVRAGGGHVLEVLDSAAGEDGDGAFIISALARHGSVADRLLAARRRRAPFPRRLALDVLVALGETLPVAHEAGILHRDVKPANIMLDEHDRPFVGDWGIARASHDKTITAGWIGSVHYMAPEVLAREAKASVRSEVFSCAVVAYELLTGVRPFDDVRRGEAPMRPTARVADLPDAVDNILLRGLADRPADRWPSVKAMIGALSQTLRTWAAADPATSVGAELAVAAEVLRSDELAFVVDYVEPTRAMPHRPRRRRPVARGDADDAHRLYRSITVLILSLTLVVCIAYLWVPVGDAIAAVGTVADKAAAWFGSAWAWLRREGERGLVPLGIAVVGSAAAYRWLGAGTRLSGGSLVATGTVVAVLFSLALPRSPAREHYGVSMQRAAIVRGMRAEGKRWARHYDRFPDEAAREQAARTVRQAIYAVRQAGAHAAGYAVLRQGDDVLRRWREQRRDMAADGNW